MKRIKSKSTRKSRTQWAAVLRRLLDHPTLNLHRALYPLPNRNLPRDLDSPLPRTGHGGTAGQKWIGLRAHDSHPPPRTLPARGTGGRQDKNAVTSAAAAESHEYSRSTMWSLRHRQRGSGMPALREVFRCDAGSCEWPTANIREQAIRRISGSGVRYLRFLHSRGCGFESNAGGAGGVVAADMRRLPHGVPFGARALAAACDIRVAANPPNRY
jgi:hypothetical protein